MSSVSEKEKTSYEEREQPSSHELEHSGETSAEYSRLLRKVDKQLLPFVTLLYLLSFLCVSPYQFTFIHPHRVHSQGSRQHRSKPNPYHPVNTDPYMSHRKCSYCGNGGRSQADRPEVRQLPFSAGLTESRNFDQVQRRCRGVLHSLRGSGNPFVSLTSLLHFSFLISFQEHRFEARSPIRVESVPHCLCMHSLTAARPVPSIMVAWGLVMTLMCLCNTYESLIMYGFVHVLQHFR